MSVLDYKVLETSEVPLADVASVALGGSAFTLLSWIALFSTMNTVLVVSLGGSRIVYGMAYGGSLPKVLSKVHPKYKTPWVAILGIALLSSLFIAFQDIGIVANIANFMIFIVFFMVNLAVIKLRYTEPERKRPFRVPFHMGTLPLLPLLGIFSILFLFTQLNREAIIYGAVLAGISIIIVIILTGKEKQKKGNIPN